MSFTFQRLKLPDVLLIEPQSYSDQRGFFMEAYKKSEFAANGISVEFVQDNYSHSTYGILRGLHYQVHPAAQAKLIMVITGEVFDVAVDIRKSSPTYGQWVGHVLSDKKNQLLYIPAGFAHGFCVLSDKADFLYKVTAEYAQDLDRGIVWNDPAIGINWPITDPILSAKDANLPTLSEADINFS